MIQCATALAVWLSAIFLGWSYAAGWRTSGEMQASAAAILPATILMGIGFPIALHLAALPTPRDAAQPRRPPRRPALFAERASARSPARCSAASSCCRCSAPAAR